MNEAEFKEISDFLNLLADASKKITLDGFLSDKSLQIKIDGSPVTEFDKNSEKIMCKLISEKFKEEIQAKQQGIFNESTPEKEVGKNNKTIPGGK